MDPVEEYARLQAEARRLEQRMAVLRAGFLVPGARRQSTRHEVVVRVQRQAVFVKERLPRPILDDPAYWQEQRSQIVSLQALSEEEFRLTEDEGRPVR